MPPPDPKSDSLSASRRDFFRKVLFKGLDQMEAAARTASARFGSLISPPPAGPVPTPEATAAAGPPRVLLRPPGALPELAFLDTCTRCAHCVEACPAHCIVIAPQEDGPGAGRPYIHARTSPCVICTDLSCMTACPSGALQPTAREAIRMGLAVVNESTCLRHAAPDGAAGQDCQLCVSHCPIGTTALRVDDAGVIAVGAGCTGCGVCEWICPTAPPAISVQPPGLSADALPPVSS